MMKGTFSKGGIIFMRNTLITIYVVAAIDDNIGKKFYDFFLKFVLTLSHYYTKGAQSSKDEII
jgi:hypothetical protein